MPLLALPFACVGISVVPQYRAAFSDAVPPEHQGKLSAALKLLESLPLVVAAPLLSAVYAATVKAWAWAVFLMLAALVAVVAALLFFAVEPGSLPTADKKGEPPRARDRSDGAFSKEGLAGGEDFTGEKPGETWGSLTNPLTEDEIISKPQSY